MKSPLALSLSFAVALSLPWPSFAAGKGETKAPAMEAAKPAAAGAEKEASMKPTRFQGKVAMVDTKAGTFTITRKGGKEEVFTVNKDAKIEKADGSVGTLADIKADEMVHGMRMKGAEGKSDVTKVVVGAREEKPKKAAKNDEKAADSKPAEKK